MRIMVYGARPGAGVSTLASLLAESAPGSHPVLLVDLDARSKLSLRWADKHLNARLPVGLSPTPSELALLPGERVYLLPGRAGHEAINDSLLSVLDELSEFAPLQVVCMGLIGEADDIRLAMGVHGVELLVLSPTDPLPEWGSAMRVVRNRTRGESEDARVSEQGAKLTISSLRGELFTQTPEGARMRAELSELWQILISEQQAPVTEQELEASSYQELGYQLAQEGETEWVRELMELLGEMEPSERESSAQTPPPAGPPAWQPPFPQSPTPEESPVSPNFTEAIKERSDLSGEVEVSPNFTEAIKERSDLSGEVEVSPNFTEAIKERSDLSGEVEVSPNFTEAGDERSESHGEDLDLSSQQEARSPDETGAQAPAPEPAPGDGEKSQLSPLPETALSSEAEELEQAEESQPLSPPQSQREVGVEAGGEPDWRARIRFAQPAQKGESRGPNSLLILAAAAAASALVWAGASLLLAAWLRARKD